MGKPWPRKQMYRTHLADYQQTWSEFFTFKREDGILEMAMHTEHAAAKWSLELHRAFIPALADVHHDPDNEILIFTGTGDRFLDSMDVEGWERYEFRQPMNFDRGYDFWYRDQVHEPFSLLNLEIPVIGAINGPFFIHQELALLNDIVIATESTTMADGHYTGMGIVPGDGVQTIFRELMGINRAKYFLLTGQSMTARELLDMGLIGEVVPDDKLLERAWEIARTVFLPRARSTRAMTRALLVQPWRKLLIDELPNGMAHESWGVHGYWGMAQDNYDIENLKQGE